MKQFLIVFAIIVGLIALTFAANEMEIFGTRFWGVRAENARRENFEQTQSYVEAKKQTLVSYYDQWRKAKTAQEKEGIRQLLLQEFANFDITKLTTEEQTEFKEIRGY